MKAVSTAQLAFAGCWKKQIETHRVRLVGYRPTEIVLLFSNNLNSGRCDSDVAGKKCAKK